MFYKTDIEIDLLSFAEHIGNCATDDEICSFLSRLLEEVEDTPISDKILMLVKVFHGE